MHNLSFKEHRCLSRHAYVSGDARRNFFEFNSTKKPGIEDKLYEDYTVIYKGEIPIVNSEYIEEYAWYHVMSYLTYKDLKSLKCAIKKKHPTLNKAIDEDFNIMCLK